MTHILETPNRSAARNDLRCDLLNRWTRREVSQGWVGFRPGAQEDAMSILLSGAWRVAQSPWRGPTIAPCHVHLRHNEILRKLVQLVLFGMVVILPLAACTPPVDDQCACERALGD